MKILKNRSIWEYILLAFLVLQVCLIAYTNFTRMESNIDCDSAKLFVHAIEMWRNGTIIIPAWTGVSTLELDCSTLLALPIYGLTKNIYFSYAVANIAFLTILISVIFYLFDRENTLLYPLLSAILVSIPYQMGMLEYFNMLYFNGSQYIIKVTIPILFLALLLHADALKENKKNKIKFIVFSVIGGILLFVSALSSGVYIFLCGILPIMAGSMLWRLFKNQKIKWTYISTIAVTIIVFGSGYICNHLFHISEKGSSMQFVVYGDLIDNILRCVIAVFEVFGGVAYYEINILSFEGLSILARIVLVIALLVCIFTVKIKEAKEIQVGLLLIFIWNTFILCVCNTIYGFVTFEYRYHLIGMIPVLCLSSKVFLDWIKGLRPSLQKAIGVSGILFITVLMITSYKAILTKEDPNVECREICNYAEEQGIDYVYFLYESQAPEICRLIDHENALYFQLMNEGNIYVFDYYEKYDQHPMIAENFIVICDNDIHDFGDNMEIFGYKFGRSRIIGTKSVYEVTGFVE